MQKIHKYFDKKYGGEFGEIFLAAITSGEEGCKAAINNSPYAETSEHLMW